MAPKSAWNPKAKQNDALYTAVAPLTSAINYKQVQDEEIEVLRAIYMEDYDEVETKSAWSQTTDRSFKLTLKSFSDSETSVVLAVTLTATYPKTVPLLQLEHLAGLHERTCIRIQNVIRLEPKEMTGEVKIHAISSDIQEALEDAVSAREQGVLSSLEDERATHEEVATSLAKQAKDEQVRLQAETQAEEDRVLKQMVDQEIARREQRKPSNSVINPAIESAESREMIRFDQPITLQNITSCTSVCVVSKLFKQTRGELLLVQPIIQSTPYSAQPLVARRINLDTKLVSRKKIVSLEAELEVLKSLRQVNVASLWSFRFDRQDEVLQLTILLDFGNRGSLFELIEDGALSSLSRAKQWTVDLLEATDYLHRNAIVHKDIHAKNILISRSIGEQPVPKLADSMYEQHIHELQGSDPGWKKLPLGWQAPECTTDVAKSRKSDVWELGVVFLQMLFGKAILEHASPLAICNRVDLSEELADLVRKWLERDSRKRPSAFDVIPSEFLRTDASTLAPHAFHPQRRRTSDFLVSSSARLNAISRRSRHNSQNVPDSAVMPSRYANDFAELGRLGRGGFGEVVKARNKLDGGIYAIKKVKQDSASKLEHVLSEVMLLNRLNHPYVVRYFSTWVEDDVSGTTQLDEESISTTEDPTTPSSGDCARMDFGMASTGGLDFVSSSGYPQIEFGDDDDETGSDSDSEAGDEVDAKSIAIPESAGLRLAKTASDSRRATRSTLYIQMEFCERQTLRDLILKDLYDKPDDSWRLLRQITEGLVHIHNHGIIHRDLKPDNVFIDMAGNPRIGDFGLATTSLYQNVEKATMSSNTGGDMTRSVGTALYVAPELRSGAAGAYTNKVDMYSLGIIFFEMTFPLNTAMERDRVIRQIREKDHVLPTSFQTTDKAAQGSIITLLISHKPSERPTAAGLLRSDKLPMKIEDETIRQALGSLSDTSSPYHHKMMSALFSQGPDQRVKEVAWQLKGDTSGPGDDNARCRAAAKDALEAVFRRHGAEESDRPTIFPRSAYYTNPNLVQLLDASGNLLQLPFDLTLPNARSLAHSRPASQKTFVFGSVYRDTFKGGPPRPSREVDFDIISSASSTESDSALEEAEVLKVMDEIIEDIPALSTSQMCIHISHGTLVDCILDICRIDVVKRTAVKEILSKLNLQKWTWSSIRDELRSPGLAIPATSLDDLQQFDFRDTPSKAAARLRELCAGTSQEAGLNRALTELDAVVRYASIMCVVRKIYLSPLSCFNEKFYTRTFIFQVVHDRKQRDVFAAGGRYDSLIAAHRPRDQLSGARAVGVSIGFDRLVTLVARHVKRPQKSMHGRRAQITTAPPSAWIGLRCDAIVVASDAAAIEAGLRVVVDLWGNGIRAELGTESSEAEFAITVKHEASTTVRVRKTDGDSAGQDVPVAGLLSYLRQEMRERDSMRVRQPVLNRHASQNEATKSKVQVLMSQHRSKKSNKYQIVEAAQRSWSEKMEEWKSAGILAVDSRDDVLECVRETRLSEAESWRKAFDGVPLNERQYLLQVQDILLSMRRRWAEDGDGSREACIFNFRSGTSYYYDLGL